MPGVLIKFAALTATLLLTLAGAATARAAAKPGWLDNQPAALALAKADKKMVLMDFTGSDWCPWCFRLNKEIFSTPEFKQYARDHLVLLEVDFPEQRPIAPQTILQNLNLAREYGIETFPTLIVLNSEGKPVKAIKGYLPVGPKAFIAELQKIKS